MKLNRDFRLYFKTVLLVLDKEREKCSRRRSATTLSTAFRAATKYKARSTDFKVGL